MADQRSDRRSGDLNGLFKPRILHRAQIKKKLEDIFNVPLYFVISGMGFGKTTAVRDFLRKKRKLKLIWFTFENEEIEDMWLWVRFSKIMDQVNTRLGHKMIEHGMPHNKYDMDRFVSDIKEEMEMDTVVVFDDVQHCVSAYLLDTIKQVALNNIPGLHIVMISREYPPIEADGLLSTSKAKIMTQNDLRFSKQECQNFFILNDAQLNADEQEILWEKTNGWASAVYLALMHYRLNGDFNFDSIGTQLMKSAIYNRFDEDVQRALMELSKLSNFQLDQAELITGSREVRNVIKQMYENNCFTKYDANSELYSFHSMFRELLDEEFEGSGLDESVIYRRQGNWCLTKGDLIGAVSAFAKCREHGKILQIMSDHYAANIMNSAPNVIIKAFNNMDIATKLSNPIGYLTYIYSYITVIDIKKGSEMLEHAKQYYLKQSRENRLNNSDQVIGEIAFIESISAFNDMHKMFECYERANKYFNGGTSRIFNADSIITFGVPITLFLYHKEPGDLKDIVELVENEFWIFNHISNGCGAGYEYMVRAEYEYKQGNFEIAEMIAYKAIYKAKTREQCGIILSASFILLRVALFEGRGREMNDILLQMVQAVEKDGSSIMLTCYEYILGYVFSFLGKFELIPQWLKDRSVDNMKLMAPARDCLPVIIGKVLCETGEFDDLEDFSTWLEKDYKEKNNLTGVIIAKCFAAIAAYHSRNMPEAVERLKQALELAEPDNDVVTISENTYEIIPILEEIGTPFAKRVLKYTSMYTESRSSFRNKQKHIPLTKREHEVMELVCDGYTAEAISKILYVSHSTVKKHISGAYSKLGVNKKSDAIAAFRRKNKGKK